MSIKNLIKMKESQILEFKSRILDGIGKDICAFANTNDGTVIVGISDKGEIIGAGKEDEEKIGNIAHSCDPPIRPKVKRELIDDKEILVVEVKKDGKIHSYKNVVYVRVGTSNKPLSMQEILELGQKLGKIRFDEQICEGSRIKDIDEKKVEWYLEKRKEIRRVGKPKGMSIEQLLINIGAAKETKNGMKPTNAGILFFGKNPQRFILQSQLRLARFAGKTLTRDFLDRFNCFGTLWEMVEQSEGFIRKNIRLFGFRTGFSFRRIDKLEYPIKAIREAVINALIHRDYFKTADTRVAIFDDRIEITNPGSFPEGVTPEKPRHVPVNPTICQLMYDVGFIEKYGTGIYMINELCEEWGMPKPEFDLSEIETAIIFRSGGKAIVISQIEKLGVELNDRQRKALKYAFREGLITNQIYRKVNKVSDETSRQELSQLVEKDLLKIVGKGRAVKYVPTIGD